VDRLLSVSDAAAALGLSAEAVRKLEQRGLLPAIRTSSGWRLFRHEDIERLRQLSERRPTRWHPYPPEARDQAS
jgi:DNA-binding transcriptional MerR regulator